VGGDNLSDITVFVPNNSVSTYQGYFSNVSGVTVKPLIGAELVPVTDKNLFDGEELVLEVSTWNYSGIDYSFEYDWESSPENATLTPDNGKSTTFRSLVENTTGYTVTVAATFNGTKIDLGSFDEIFIVTQNCTDPQYIIYVNGKEISETSGEYKVDPDYVKVTPDIKFTQGNDLVTVTPADYESNLFGKEHTLLYGDKGLELTFSAKLTCHSGDPTEYTIKLTRDASSNTNVVLSVNSTELEPPSDDGAVKVFTHTVPYSTSSVTVTATSSNLNASHNGDFSVFNSLAEGVNEVSFIVTAEDGINSQNYKLEIIRQAQPQVTPTPPSSSSSDAGISKIYVQGQSVSNFKHVVGNSVSTVNIVIYLNSNYASISSGIQGQKDLVIGDNNFPFTVTAQDGTTRSYNLLIVRASNDASLKSLSIPGFTLSPSFYSDILNYSLSLSSSISDLELLYIVNNSNSTVEVSGNLNIPFGVSTITIKVIAQDKTIRNYKIQVTKLADSTPDAIKSPESVIGVQFSGQVLQVNSPLAERVHIYTITGTLLGHFDKSAGNAIFSLDPEHKFIILKSSSGWSRKLISNF
jgi:hypothetical protein